MISLLNLLDDGSMQLTEHRLHDWESLINTPLLLENTKEITIDPVIGLQYVGDFYGLLHNILNIPNVACFINMRINHLTSSLEYKGATTIKLIDPTALADIITYMNQRENIA